MRLLWTWFPWMFWRTQTLYVCDLWDNTHTYRERSTVWEQMVLNDDGSVVIGNRVYRRGEAIPDVVIAGSVISRPDWSNTLAIRTSSGELLGLRFTRLFSTVYWDRLIPLSPNPPGLHSVRPSLFAKVSLFAPIWAWYVLLGYFVVLGLVPGAAPASLMQKILCFFGISLLGLLVMYLW